MADRALRLPDIETELDRLLRRAVPRISRRLVSLWLRQARALTAVELDAIASGRPSRRLLGRLERDYEAWLDRHLAAEARRAAQSSSRQVRDGLERVGVEIGVALVAGVLAATVARRMDSRRDEWLRRQRDAWAEIGRADISDPRLRRDVARASVGLTARQARGLRTLALQLDGDPSYTPARRRALLEQAALKSRRTRGDRLGRTEIVDSYGAGMHATAGEAQRRRLISGTQKRWRTQRDELRCDECRALHGVVRSLRDPFPGGMMHPPAHPNCRCVMDLIVTV